MPSLGDTAAWLTSGAGDGSTAPSTLPSIRVDGHRIRSLRSRVSPVEGTGPGNGIAGPEDETLTRARTQIAPMGSSGKAFRLLAPKVSTVRTATLYPTQEWEGQVVEVRSHELEARLLDVTSGDRRGREVATIPLQELSAEDRTGVRVGSIFRWVIGYERSVGGTRRRVSQIVFLDPPRLSDRDLKRGREWAAWLREGWDEE